MQVGTWTHADVSIGSAAFFFCPQEEIDAAVERIKQKRRESAQRSRARKNDYMHQLELENQALKDEVQRLQQVLGAMQRTAFQQQQAAAIVQLGPVM
jgi:cell shape-determining protein MreC